MLLLSTRECDAHCSNTRKHRCTNLIREIISPSCEHQALNASHAHVRPRSPISTFILQQSAPVIQNLTHVLTSLLRCLCPFEQEQAHGLLVKAAGGPQALANCVGSFLVWEDPKKKGAKTLSLVNTHGLIEDNAITRDSDGACFYDFFSFRVLS